MDYFKKIERSVTISADKRSTVDLQVDVWSQDLNVTKFILKLDTTDSTTIDLMNATVRVAMVYNQDGQDVKIEAAGIVEDIATQKIAYIMDNRLAGFEGTVMAGFYVTLRTGQRIDIQNVTFNMQKSLLDKDLEAATESYYQTFDDIVVDVESHATTQKSAIDAVVTDVNGYGNSQKQTINAVVTDVQTTGNTAKNQINQVLPSVQSQVSELNRQINALPQIPDLFVAYADNLTGSGFSQTDTSKLYKGYGVKNSDLASDYRWERNVEQLSTGGDNLIINGGFPTDTSGWYKQGNGRFEVRKHPFYFNQKKNMFCIINNNKVAGYEGREETIVYSEYFSVKPNTDYTLSFFGFSSWNVASTEVHYMGKLNKDDGDYSNIITLFTKAKMPFSHCQYYKYTFNSGNSNFGSIKFNNNGSTDGNNNYMFF